MEIDLQRWGQLIDEIAVTRAEHIGLGNMAVGLERACGQALVTRMRSDEALERAKRSVHRGDILDGYQMALDAASAEVVRLDREFAVMSTRLSALAQRLGALSAIEQRCRAWARTAGIILPDGDTVKHMTVQGAPEGARQFGAGQGDGSGLRAAGPLDAPAAPPPSALDGLADVIRRVAR
ncbi:MAG TPA: hypothetical protein VMF62_19800 [Acetobacteraceae bacterium]|nr:hypothetical protein [Acetobacteraceae bacterium]